MTNSLGEKAKLSHPNSLSKHIRNALKISWLFTCFLLGVYLKGMLWRLQAPLFVQTLANNEGQQLLVFIFTVADGAHRKLLQPAVLQIPAQNEGESRRNDHLQPSHATPRSPPIMTNSDSWILKSQLIRANTSWWDQEWKKRSIINQRCH